MKVHTLEPILAAHPFFEGMRQKDLDLLTGCASNVRFEEGEHLIRQGAPAERFFLIREGRVALEVSASGLEPLQIQTLGEGEILGWSWLFPPYRWTFDGRALERVRALALDGVCLRGKCDEDPELGYELMKRFAAVVVDRLENTRVQLLDLYGK